MLDTLALLAPGAGWLGFAVGLAVRLLPRLRDVDDFDDALAVAAGAPGTRFAAAVGRFSRPSA